MLINTQVDKLLNLFVIFFNDTATAEIYTLSLHDALPICLAGVLVGPGQLDLGAGPRDPVRGTAGVRVLRVEEPQELHRDRKSTRLNSSHANISYAVSCLKKKNLLVDHTIIDIDDDFPINR